jgi:transcriptional regulator with XRE-family HTH domain
VGRFLLSLLAVRLSHRRIVGEQIRLFRKQARLSQEELAEKAELSYKYIGEVERGCVNISLDSLMRIAKALEVKAHTLIGEL